MGELVGERRRETEKERERDRKREGGVKQMCQNCIPTMNMNTLCDIECFFFIKSKSYGKLHRVFIFIVGIQFWHICFTPPSLSLSLFFSLPPSLPTNSLIYHSLLYLPHRLNILKWKERKGGREGERER